MKISYYVEIRDVKKEEINYKSILHHNKELQDIHIKAGKQYGERTYLSCNDYSSSKYITFSCVADTVRGVEVGRSLLEKYIKDLRSE